YLTWSDWGFGEGTPDLSTAHMLIGAACAYDWLWPYLSATDRANLAARVGSEAARIAAAMPSAWWNDEYVQNHNWIDTAALGLAALALWGEDARAPAWLTLAQDHLAGLS